MVTGMPVVNQVDQQDMRTLEACEMDMVDGAEEVEGGFNKIAKALRTVRERKLYRLKGYDKFEDYCKGERKKGVAWANRHIAHLDLIESVIPLLGGEVASIANELAESATRPLRTMDPASAAAVLTHASENGADVPTAEEVVNAKNWFESDDDNGDFEDESGYSDEGESVPDDEGTFPTDESESEPTTASVVLDKLGNEVPVALRVHHETGAKLAAEARRLSDALKSLKELSSGAGGEFLPLSDIETKIVELKTMVSHARYYTACPRCEGKGGCDLCKDHRFIPQSRSGMLTKEEKEIVQA